MASVRAIRVGRASYVQVVEYYRRPSGRQAIRVVKSFGKYTLESWLRANQYVASYNQLKQATEAARKSNTNGQDFLRGALTVFGAILGAALIASILNEIFGEND